MPAKGQQLESGSMIAGYRIDQLISRGGMGIIYRATNVALSRICALKVLAPELADDEQFRQRFQREMRLAASLHHPHVVGIHDAGEHQGRLFFVMDFISGSDLRDLIRGSGAIAPDRVIELLTQVASALDAAHARGLVHRDVKPANILIAVRDGEEHAYLTDFGLAKRLDTEASLPALTQTGVAMGTVDYMAPEQITGDRVDARTDIYGLGCIFFEMLTGEVPYERENSIATIFAHVHDPPPSLEGPLAERYPRLDEVIARALAKNPDQRYLSAGDFARAAAAALAGASYTAADIIVATGEARPAAPSPAAPPQPDEHHAAQPAALTSGPHTSEESAPAAAHPDAGSPAAPPASPPVPEPAPPARRRRPHRWLAVAGPLALCAAIATLLALSLGGSRSGVSGTPFAALLRAVPTNNVSGSGTAVVRIDGNRATVTVDTTGLLGAPHLMHIHGGTGNCPSAADARPYRGHTAIGAAEGDKVYGPVVTSLTRSGSSTSPALHLAWPLYPNGGTIRYTRTLTLAPWVAVDIAHGLGVIVVHGIDYNHNGTYDDFLGPSSPGSTVTAEEAAPALCGPLVPTQTPTANSHALETTYTASLHTSAASDAPPAPTPPLLCHLADVLTDRPQPSGQTPARAL